MDFEAALKLVDDAVFANAGRHLNDAEVTVLRGAWEGKTYDKMAESSTYRLNYLMRDVGPNFWKLLSEAFGEEVSKKNFRATLERIWRSHQSPAIVEKPLKTGNSAIENDLSSKFGPDWGEAPDVSIFYGRAEELNQLEQWIDRDRCRLVGLFGMGGIGKTALSVKLAHRLKSKFKYVVWRSLRNAPSIQDLLAQLLLSLNLQETDIPKNEDERISCLISYLRDHRCLLVLDDIEMILHGNSRGRYQVGYEKYGTLFRQIGQQQHQSCLIVIGLEKPIEVALLESPIRPVRSWKLEGLQSEAVQQILQEKGLIGNPQYWEELKQIYGGSPLALKLIAGIIQDVFNKDVAKYINLGTIAIGNDYREVLDKHFQRLSDLEEKVMRSLAQENQPISFEKLRENLEIDASDLIETLKSLWWRSLIEKVQHAEENTTNTLFGLQPVIRKYITKYHQPSA